MKRQARQIEFRRVDSDVERRENPFHSRQPVRLDAALIPLCYKAFQTRVLYPPSVEHGASDSQSPSVASSVMWHESF
jgi:hypothetical protein